MQRRENKLDIAGLNDRKVTAVALPHLPDDSKSNIPRTQTSISDLPFTTYPVNVPGNIRPKDALPDRKQEQSLIDRLLSELDSKATAIQQIGQDILQYRHLNHAKDLEIVQLNERLSESEIKTRRLIHGFDLDALDPTELRRRYALLANKLETLIDTHRKLQLKYNDLSADVQEKRDVELKIRQLELAHMAQQALVMSLQESANKSNQLKIIVRKQETVISKLEERNGIFGHRKDTEGLEESIIKPKTHDSNTRRESSIYDPTESVQYKRLVLENKQLKQRLLDSDTSDKPHVHIAANS